MEKRIKVLNLYAGIGGNRKLWKDVEVTAIENNKDIAKIYQNFFPNDKVIITDAHKYLKDNYMNFDFIWSSPPCPTHSRFNFLKKEQIDSGFKPQFPDMKLYEEIIFLSFYFDGKWVVENVKSFYKPLIKPYESGNHYFWANFDITNMNDVKRGIRTKTIEQQEKERGFKIPDDLSKTLRKKVLNNCVFPDLGLHVFNCAFKETQEKLI